MQEIPLPNVKSPVLSKVIEFCSHHHNNPMREIEKVVLFMSFCATCVDGGVCEEGWPLTGACDCLYPVVYVSGMGGCGARSCACRGLHTAAQEFGHARRGFGLGRELCGH